MYPTASDTDIQLMDTLLLDNMWVADRLLGGELGAAGVVEWMNHYSTQTNLVVYKLIHHRH